MASIPLSQLMAAKLSTLPSSCKVVLNYFNGNGLGGGFPTARGANNAGEFERQRAKIINALVAMDADIVGLVEIENDGYGPESAISRWTITPKIRS